jgi:hypothetical protein
VKKSIIKLRTEAGIRIMPSSCWTYRNYIYIYIYIQTPLLVQLSANTTTTLSALQDHESLSTEYKIQIIVLESW